MSDEEDILSLATQRIGTVLHGKYRLDAVLGIGGMAVVYAATHRNRKQFAVKMLRPEFAVRTEFRTRFLREGYAANSVAHEGVVAVLDDDVDEAGTAFLVMELLQGADVELLCSRWGGKLPLHLALAVAHQVLSVLNAAHQKAVIHRDLKPANFFVVKSGQVKVLDFGIARLREVASSVRSTRSGAVLGTPAFMAPEQASGQSREIDARTDLWALGASLFTMLSGQFVHEAENGAQTLIQAATTPARSLSSAAPELPARVIELVDRALSFDRAARWASASAMSEAVAEAHGELFGELLLEPLQTCVAGFGAPRYVNGARRLSSSVAGALGKSETTADTPMRAGADSERLSTTAKPLADLKQERPGRGQHRGALIVGVLAALLGLALLSRAIRTPRAGAGVQAAPNAPLAAAPAAAPLAPPPGFASSAWAAPAPQPAPAVEAVTSPRPRTVAATRKAALAKLALSTARPLKSFGGSGAPEPTASATPAALAPSNPLGLELQ